MANNKLLIDERQADLGNFMVGRLLPFRKKRQVGPFTFIDHMGPAELGNGKFVDVDQHPHIGLSTLTYLFEGEIEHRDSIGSIQIIKAGDVGFMTAGKEVTHTERTPVSKRIGTMTMHGYQVWVALLPHLENMEPRFDFIASDKIPQKENEEVRIKVVAGNAFGLSAPLQGFSPLFMVDIYAKQNCTLDLKEQLKGEVAMVVVKGSIVEEGQSINAGQMLISKSNEACSIFMEANTQILLFGGEPLGQEHYLL